MTLVIYITHVLFLLRATAKKTKLVIKFGHCLDESSVVIPLAASQNFIDEMGSPINLNFEV